MTKNLSGKHTVETLSRGEIVRTAEWQEPFLSGAEIETGKEKAPRSESPELVASRLKHKMR